MYKRILATLDGSKLAEGILPYLRWLASELKVPVEFLYVNDPHELAPYAPPLQGREYLEKIAASFSGFAHVQCTVELGNPPAVIADLADAQPGTLIAMATHGYSGAKRWLLGSVAEKVLRGAKSDLLLVRPSGAASGNEIQLKTLLVALDGSALGEKVLPVVGELVAAVNLQVRLMRVLNRVYTSPPEGFLPVFGANVPNLQQLWGEAKAEVESYLAEKVKQLRAKGLSQVSATLTEAGVDGVAGAIVDLAMQSPGSLIVMSSHGESGIGRWLIGSVTERVIRHSSRPVLVIRPR